MVINLSEVIELDWPTKLASWLKLDWQAQRDEVVINVSRIRDYRTIGSQPASAWNLRTIEWLHSYTRKTESGECPLALLREIFLRHFHLVRWLTVLHRLCNFHLGSLFAGFDSVEGKG